MVTIGDCQLLYIYWSRCELAWYAGACLFRLISATMFVDGFWHEFTAESVKCSLVKNMRCFIASSVATLLYSVRSLEVVCSMLSQCSPSL